MPLALIWWVLLFSDTLMALISSNLSLLALICSTWLFCETDDFSCESLRDARMSFPPYSVAGESLFGLVNVLLHQQMWRNLAHLRHHFSVAIEVLEIGFFLPGRSGLRDQPSALAIPELFVIHLHPSPFTSMHPPCPLSTVHRWCACPLVTLQPPSLSSPERS